MEVLTVLMSLLPLKKAALVSADPPVFCSPSSPKKEGS